MPIKKWYLVCMVSLCFIFLLSGCKAEKKPAATPVVEKPVVEEAVIQDMPDEEAAKLINQVREYAEAFDIGLVDKDIRSLLKTSIAKGSKAEEIREAAHDVVLPFMEDQLRLRIEEGLKSITGSAAEEDIEEVYSYMDPEDLVSFIVDYEIERLKMEGYLR